MHAGFFFYILTSKMRFVPFLQIVIPVVLCIGGYQLGSIIELTYQAKQRRMHFLSSLLVILLPILICATFFLGVFPYLFTEYLAPGENTCRLTGELRNRVAAWIFMALPLLVLAKKGLRVVMVKIYSAYWTF